MKARALILTVGTTLALMAPAAQSASARSSLSCDYLATHALSDRGIAPGPFSAQNRRNMLAVATGQWVTSGKYALAGCSTRKATSAHKVTVAHGGLGSASSNGFQVLRNSI